MANASELNVRIVVGPNGELSGECSVPVRGQRAVFQWGLASLFYSHPSDNISESKGCTSFDDCSCSVTTAVDTEDGSHSIGLTNHRFIGSQDPTNSILMEVDTIGGQSQVSLCWLLDPACVGRKLQGSAFVSVASWLVCLVGDWWLPRLHAVNSSGKLIASPVRLEVLHPSHLQQVYCSGAERVVFNANENSNGRSHWTFTPIDPSASSSPPRLLSLCSSSAVTEGNAHSSHFTLWHIPSHVLAASRDAMEPSLHRTWKMLDLIVGHFWSLLGGETASKPLHIIIVPNLATQYGGTGRHLAMECQGGAILLDQMSILQGVGQEGLMTSLIYSHIFERVAICVYHSLLLDNHRWMRLDPSDEWLILGCAVWISRKLCDVKFGRIAANMRWIQDLTALEAYHDPHMLHFHKRPKEFEDDADNDEEEQEHLQNEHKDNHRSNNNSLNSDDKNNTSGDGSTGERKRKRSKQRERQTSTTARSSSTSGPHPSVGGNIPWSLPILDPWKQRSSSHSLVDPMVAGFLEATCGSRWLSLRQHQLHSPSAPRNSFRPRPWIVLVDNDFIDPDLFERKAGLVVRQLERLLLSADTLIEVICHVFRRREETASSSLTDSFFDCINDKNASMTSVLGGVAQWDSNVFRQIWVQQGTWIASELVYDYSSATNHVDRAGCASKVTKVLVRTKYLAPDLLLPLSADSSSNSPTPILSIRTPYQCILFECTAGDPTTEVKTLKEVQLQRCSSTTSSQASLRLNGNNTYCSVRRSLAEFGAETRVDCSATVRHSTKRKLVPKDIETGDLKVLLLGYMDSSVLWVQADVPGFWLNRPVVRMSHVMYLHQLMHVAANMHDQVEALVGLYRWLNGNRPDGNRHTIGNSLHPQVTLRVLRHVIQRPTCYCEVRVAALRIFFEVLTVWEARFEAQRLAREELLAGDILVSAAQQPSNVIVETQERFTELTGIRCELDHLTTWLQDSYQRLSDISAPLQPPTKTPSPESSGTDSNTSELANILSPAPVTSDASPPASASSLEVETIAHVYLLSELGSLGWSGEGPGLSVFLYRQLCEMQMPNAFSPSILLAATHHCISSVDQLVQRGKFGAPLALAQLEIMSLVYNQLSARCNYFLVVECSDAEANESTDATSSFPRAMQFAVQHPGLLDAALHALVQMERCIRRSHHLFARMLDHHQRSALSTVRWFDWKQRFERQLIVPTRVLFYQATLLLFDTFLPVPSPYHSSVEQQQQHHQSHDALPTTLISPSEFLGHFMQETDTRVVEDVLAFWLHALDVQSGWSRCLPPSLSPDAVDEWRQVRMDLHAWCVQMHSRLAAKLCESVFALLFAFVTVE